MNQQVPERRRTLDVGQLLLPFAEREYVDVKRAARILGVSHSSVLALYAAGQIDMIDYAKRKRKRVRYQSIVDLCERLRAHYCIKDRRPALPAAFFRHRDADLLPFPMEHTLNIEQVMEILGYSSRAPVYAMIEEGRFEAYQLSTLNPWRISRNSLAEYLQSVHDHERVVVGSLEKRF